MSRFTPGQPVWVLTDKCTAERAAVIVHLLYVHEGAEWWGLTDVEGLPTKPGKKGWRAEAKYIRPRTDDDPLKVVDWSACIWQPNKVTA